MKTKVGDTLIEVTLAIGIFSMVAVAVAAVVNGSTSGAQVALETTVTREEIDSQAEALRFIHASYIAGGQTNEEGEDRYVRLWRAITERSKETGESYGETEPFNFVPDTCSELYEGNKLNTQGAFIINTRALGLINNVESISDFDEIRDRIIITPNDGGNGPFAIAATYPRILYQESFDPNQEVNLDDTIFGQGTGSTISRVEGLYVIPVREYDNSDSTIIIDGGSEDRKPSYYDFYIRSCWFGPGADRPSTISTVIRLYDPNIIEY